MRRERSVYDRDYVARLLSTSAIAPPFGRRSAEVASLGSNKLHESIGEISTANRIRIADASPGRLERVLGGSMFSRTSVTPLVGHLA